jgi:DNA-binding winged helix-turn-helix (wHTH) protein/Tol biopolymer transport system component
MKNGEPKQIICFAGFELDTAHRRLVREGETVALNAKAFDLLVFLARNVGRVVTKDEILDAVWDGQFVEEANLTVQMSALRKALGERKDAPRLLVTIPGKGYKFVADIQNEDDEIVIEKHSVSRFVIEEGEKEKSVETEKNLAPLKISPAPRFFAFTYRKFVIGAISIFLLSAVGIYFLRAKKTNPAFERIKITRLTNNGKVKIAAISPDGNFVAYVLGEADGNSLWLRQMGAANDMRIVSPVKAEFWDLTFTPDSAQIYYNLFAGDKTDNELFRIPTLGGLTQKLSKIITYTISFAPDGKRFAYLACDSAEGQNYLMVADADGTNRQVIAQKKQPDTFFFDGDFVAWSPDGETIAVPVNHFEAESNYFSIIGVNVRDGTEKLLCPRKWRDVLSLEWMRDGSGLIVSGSDKSSLKNQIWLVAQPSGEIRAVTDDLMSYGSINTTAGGTSLVALQTASVYSLSIGASSGEENSFREIISEVGALNPFLWIPDGKIVFRSAADGTANLWAINADGTNHRQLTAAAQVDERGMCVTPDGRFIVFTSWRSGKSNLWRINADGGDLMQLTDGEADAYPVCTQDSQSVIFQRGIFSQQHLWKTSIGGGAAIKLTDFIAKWGALSTDGNRLSFFQMLDGKWHINLMSADGGRILQRFDISDILKQDEIRWSADDRSLYFIGTTGSVGNVWNLSFDGGTTKPVTSFRSHYLEDFAFSPDGTKLAVSRALQLSDVVLIEPTE